jgi:hypothetical protein
VDRPLALEGEGDHRGGGDRVDVRADEEDHTAGEYEVDRRED